VKRCGQQYKNNKKYIHKADSEKKSTVYKNFLRDEVIKKCSKSNTNNINDINIFA